MGEVAALTSSRAGRAVFLHIETSRVLGSRFIRDVSGIAASGQKGAFVATSGLGSVVLTSADGLQILAADEAWQWDNHAEAV